MKKVVKPIATYVVGKEEEKSLHDLAYKGCELEAQIKSLKEEQAKLKEKIEPLLYRKAVNEEKMSTELATALGVVKFTQTETPVIDFENFPKFKEALGNDFKLFFTRVNDPKKIYKPDNRKIKQVACDADSKVGAELRKFVSVECSTRVAFKPN